jgi:hypothetical protein
MSQNNLNGLFFPAVAGLFFFMKRPKTEEVKAVYPVYSRDSDGLSGVAKYLEHQNALLAASRKENEQEAQEPVQLVSGVARYLESQSKSSASRVAKYILRQSLAEKQKVQAHGKDEVTGVEKYLKNKKVAPGLSGVEKYLKHQAGLPQPSKVAKYLTKKSALDALQVKHSPVELSGVAKYLQHQASLPQPSRVAKYMAKQSALAALAAKPVKQQPGQTKVEQYLQHQASLPQISRVAKYLVRQALVEKQKPVVTETGVDKYMRHQG